MDAFDRVLTQPEVRAAIDAAAIEWVPLDLRDYYRRRKAEQP